MLFQDKSIQCFDCDLIFTFSAEEQKQFTSRGYANSPKRCPSCRKARKARQLNNIDMSQRNVRYNLQREMFPAVCTECKKTIQVPFQPSEDRPVYCRDCYKKVRLSK